MDWSQIWHAIVEQAKTEPAPVVASVGVVVTLSIGVWANPVSKRRRDALKTDLDIVKTASEIGIPSVTGRQLESIKSRVEKHFTPTTRIGSNIMRCGVAVLAGTSLVWVLLQFTSDSHAALEKALRVAIWIAIALLVSGFYTAIFPDLRRTLRNLMSERSRRGSRIRGTNADVATRRQRRTSRPPRWR